MSIGRIGRSLEDGLLSMLREKILTDIVLKVGGREFHAHRMVLAAGSDYFKASLTRGFKEGIDIPDFDPNIFNLVLEFIYGETPPLEYNDRLSFIGQCHYFRIKYVDIERFMEDNYFPEDNFCEYYDLTRSIYPEGDIPERYQRTMSRMINDGANVSEFSDEALMAMFQRIAYVPHNILDFHGMLSELVAKGHSPKLFSLINYQLLAEKHRPVGFDWKGPIPSLKSPDNSRDQQYVVFDIPDDDDLKLDDGLIDAILINEDGLIGDCRAPPKWVQYRVGDICCFVLNYHEFAKRFTTDMVR